MKITLLETAGWYTVFKNLRQSYSLDSRSSSNFNLEYENNDKAKYLFTESEVRLNDKDLQLLSTLVKKGDSHSKIIRGLQTYVEITAPRYWWQEWITYCIGVLELNPTIDWVSLSSESTMHTLLKEDVREDNFCNGVYLSALKVLKDVKDTTDIDYDDRFKVLKANLPEGYLQTRTYMVSYQAWRRIYQQRNNHRLEEWSKYIVEFIEKLPFAKELILI